MYTYRHIFGLTFGLWLLSLLFIPLAFANDDSSASVKTVSSAPPLSHALKAIDCSTNFSATVYASGLSAPDGLAFGPDNLLYVVEESAGQVTRLSTDGMTATVVLTDLNSPEGIAFDTTGNMYVTEDVKGGRLIKMTSGGVTETLATNLDNPEGVVWVADGTVYLTESNLEYALSISSTNVDDYRTHITSVPDTGGTPTRLLTQTAVFTIGFPVTAKFWSYAAITEGPDDKLYFTNELSGKTITGTYQMFDFIASSGESIFSLDPLTPTTAEPVAAGLTAPEGLRFGQDGQFPVYIVAEEDIGSGTGRVSSVDSNGLATSVCTGFANIEDVVIGADQRLYVSEDTTGQIIAIEIDEIIVDDPYFIWLPLITKSEQ